MKITEKAWNNITSQIGESLVENPSASFASVPLGIQSIPDNRICRVEIRMTVIEKDIND